MRKTHRLLPWILLLSMILGLLPSLPVPVRAANDSDAVVLNAMDYGADPTGAADSTRAIQAALEAAREYEAAGKTVTLQFPKGEYHIYKGHALTREYHTSNTNSIENPVKTVGLLIEEHKNLTIDGCSSLFMMHGNMTVSFADGFHASGAKGEIVIENCNFSNTHDDPINFHGTFHPCGAPDRRSHPAAEVCPQPAGRFPPVPCGR